MTPSQVIIAKFNARFGFHLPDDTNLFFIEGYCRVVHAVDLADEIKTVIEQLTPELKQIMSKYKELMEKKAANHAICEQLDEEIKKLNPDEVWVCFYKEGAYKPEVLPTEKLAMAYNTTIVEKVVRYVLPQETNETKQD